MSSGKVTKAVVPVAGKGTRLRPLTLVTPKELLPLGRKPVLEYVVEELHLVGVQCIIFVVSPDKPGIRDYFGDSTCQGDVEVRYVVQNEQLGLAHAVLQSEEAVGGEDFILALGDTVMMSDAGRGPTARMLDAFSRSHADGCICVERINPMYAHLYGIVKPVVDAPGYDAFEISGLVEKPDAGTAPSDYAIGGRYVFRNKIFDNIRRTVPGTGGELQITDSIGIEMADGGRVWCVPVGPDERRYDIGNFRVYSEAFAMVCMLDPELAPSVIGASRSGIPGGATKGG